MEHKIYEDFIPQSEISGDTDSTIIHVHLKGFKKEDLKVKHNARTNPEILRITGEMPIEGNNKWHRFMKDFQISPDCDTSKISARFEGGILSVTLPKKADNARKPDETGQTNNTASQASGKVVAPPEPKPDHQKPTGGDETETRQEASTEAGRGGSASSDPPRRPLSQPQDSNNGKDGAHESGKSANSQVNREDVSEEAPKRHEPTSLTQQAGQPNESKDETGETAAGDNKKQEGETKTRIKKKGFECSFAEMRLRKRMKTLNLTVMVLAGIGIGIGIGLCVKNMIKYS